MQVEAEEEEKEQCSPVSVLDPPFKDDDDRHVDDDDENDGFDLECSYAIVESTFLNLTSINFCTVPSGLWGLYQST